METPSAYAYFRVVAETLPLEEITQAMGIVPTDSWQKGDPGQYVASRPDSGWCLYSALPRTNTDLMAHIESLLSLLAPRAKAVQELGQRYATYLVCVGSYDETASPGLFIARESIALIASLGLALDADLYFGKQ